MKEIICGMCGNQNAVTNCWYQSDSGVQERTPVCGMCALIHKVSLAESK